MFKRIDNRIVEVDEGFSIELLGRAGLIYRDIDNYNYRDIIVDSEMLVKGRYAMIINPKNIKFWKSGEQLPESERRRIVENIRRAFAFNGEEIWVEGWDSPIKTLE